MIERIKVDISQQAKPAMINLVKALDRYMLARAKKENPSTSEYDEMADFIYKKKNGIMGLGYIPLSKHDRRIANKLHEILSTEAIINEEKISNKDKEKERSISNKEAHLEEIRSELFTIIFGNIYTSEYIEAKTLATFTPTEIVNFFDMFGEGILYGLQEREIQERNDEIAAGITGDDDDTDSAKTFYEKMIAHHERNRAIGSIVEDIANTKRISKKQIFNKTIEHITIIREYFKKYPEIFIISYDKLLDRDMMHKAMAAIFPEKYILPETKKYIDERYGIYDDEDYDDEE